MIRRLIILLLIVGCLFAREYIAIIDFEGINVSGGDAKALTQRLTSEMIKLEVYQVLERSEMKRLLEEQKIEFNQNADKAVFKVLTNTFKEYFNNPFALISLKTGLISSENFLKQYGEEAWTLSEEKMIAMCNTPDDKIKLIHVIARSIRSIDNLPKSFKNDVKTGKIKTKKIINDTGKTVEIFEIEDYENNWNFIQKFCYRRELQLKGFTIWFREKLIKFKHTLSQ